MNKDEFLKYLAPAFICGGGGLYFEEHLKETLEDNKVTLKSFAKEMKNNILREEKKGEDSYYYDTAFFNVPKLIEHPIETNKDCYDFFVLYLHGSICSYPELCGIIVGAMIKENMFDEAVELIKFNGEEIYWDS